MATNTTNPAPTLLETTFHARYKNRTPNPGICQIITIDWENKRVSMSNGACRYHPEFEEIEMVESPEPKG